MEDGDERTAYQEAGHALVDRILGYEVRDVSIIRHRFGLYRGGADIRYMLHEDSGGEELRGLRRKGVPRRRANEQLSKWAQRDAVVLMAGRGAEELLAGDYNLRGVRSDMERMMLGCVTKDTVTQDQFGNESLERAKQLLRQHWSQVNTLIEALVKHKQLGGKSVEALLG
jgi:hypothetical protein